MPPVSIKCLSLCEHAQSRVIRGVFANAPSPCESPPVPANNAISLAVQEISTDAVFSMTLSVSRIPPSLTRDLGTFTITAQSKI